MHPVRMVGHVAALTLVVLLSAQAATAQSTAEVTLSVPASVTAPQGATTTIAVNVTLTMSNFICATAPATAKVILDVSEPATMPGISVTAPEEVLFAVSDQPTAIPSTQPYSETMPVNVTVTLASNVVPNHEHKINITAAFDGSTDHTNCSSTHNLAAVTDTDAKQFSVMTGAGTGGPGGNGTTGPNGTTTNGNTSEPAVSLPIAIQVALLVGVGVLASRRKD